MLGNVTVCKDLPKQSADTAYEATLKMSGMAKHLTTT